MPVTYSESLDAAIQYLQQLKARGVKYLTVSPSTLAALSNGPRPSPPTARPVKAPRAEAPLRESPAKPVAPPASADEGPSIAVLAPRVPSSLSGEAKAAAMSELRERALGCQKCPRLAASRQNVVFGVGDINSPLLFVGEAPGADEDSQGEPFVGQAGQLLTRIIQTMGFPRDTVYIANVLKCRPDTPGQTAGNRKPTPEEMRTCLPYLLAQIDLIQPKIIVALGGTAMEGLFGRVVPITKVRGHFQDFRDIPVMPTYHPSYLLRTQALGVKRQLWEDMLQVLEKLGRPISERQRNYFLSSAQ